MPWFGENNDALYAGEHRSRKLPALKLLKAYVENPGTAICKIKWQFQIFEMQNIQEILWKTIGVSNVDKLSIEMGWEIFSRNTACIHLL